MMKTVDPKQLYKLHIDMLFLLERMKIEKCQKLCSWYGKKNMLCI